jgi:hypothetical protein
MRDPRRKVTDGLILAEIVAYYAVLVTWTLAAVIVSHS